MLTTAEILRKVRALEIKSKKLTTDLFTGEYHSAFKGRGMSFKEVREYSAGDDIRFIDWNVSARFGHPFSKVFEEERELTVMLLVDVSASSLFGTIIASKKDIATEIAAVIAFSAVNNHDKIGVIFYSDKIEKYIPPKKGKQHALFIVRELLSVQSGQKKTQLNTALRFFNNTTRQKSIAFILSDFIDTGYQDALRVAGNKHDIIGIKIYDKMDRTLPKLGLLRVEDAETGEQKWVDSESKLVRYEYEKDFFRITDYSNEVFRKAGCDLLHVRTDEDYVKILQRFFISRNK
ncbi:DUF58 domain-containing protein [Flavisolibacter ginsengisoli]|jgi:uncharacterized protein (DUF58 family)|uniref:DUF58 domain-containing protein n=1 Tax=Flavisolibacter ginsengisoli DSM 18119 TaxID=1121884 RepID=A0A1M4VXK4_9BACT|nr:DUF58 domain-containing protein [Flavisolibacter ginsengisoli]SHE73625.1 Protein of unknown function DUF58 [Flavisolibacter ginsengisoli DSM 18119]